MNGLRTALRDAADSATAGVGEHPESLWNRGRRRHRRRQALGGAGLVAALALGAVLVGAVPWSQPPREIPPMGTVQELGLPDRFYFADGRLPSTADGHEIGPLSAVVLGYREPVFGKGRPALAGVSQDGEYRYLDAEGLLPYVAEEGFALSPDGRHLAYWAAVEGSSMEIPRHDALAVYDTVTGKVQRVELDTEYGLAAGALHWYSSRELWFQPQEYVEEPDADSSSSRVREVRSLDVTTGETATVLGVQEIGFDHGGHGELVSADGDRVSLQRKGEKQRTLRVSNLLTGRVVLDPTRSQLAGTLDTDGAGNFTSSAYPLVVLASRGPEPIPVRPVPTATVFEVVGWRSADDIVVVRATEDGAEYASVGVGSGRADGLATFSGGIGAGNVFVAADAWQGQVFAAPEPDVPLDPRVLLGLAVAAGLVLLVFVRVWRRRARS